MQVAESYDEPWVLDSRSYSRTTSGVCATPSKSALSIGHPMMCRKTLVQDSTSRARRRWAVFLGQQSRGPFIWVDISSPVFSLSCQILLSNDLFCCADVRGSAVFLFVPRRIGGEGRQSKFLGQVSSFSQQRNVPGLFVADLVAQRGLMQASCDRALTGADSEIAQYLTAARFNMGHSCFSVGVRDTE